MVLYLLTMLGWLIYSHALVFGPSSRPSRAVPLSMAQASLHRVVINHNDPPRPQVRHGSAFESRDQYHLYIPHRKQRRVPHHDESNHVQQPQQEKEKESIRTE
mmetsp:Transcript_15239/g.31426  ORF Transcript_15239/g.31426 Transcript_15239/m.31426 type:complete len:103 (-) Transcript_15239:2013-2321(-)